MHFTNEYVNLVLGEVEILRMVKGPTFSKESPVKVDFPIHFEEGQKKDLWSFSLTGKCPASPTLPACGRQAGGVKGHNTNEISLARILLATACPGSPALWVGSFTNLIEKRVEGALIIQHP